MDFKLLDDALAAHGEPPFRTRQVWAWTARGAEGFEQMTDLPGALRTALGREVPFSSLAVERESRARDGTIKALFATTDSRPLEAVLMRYRDGRRSICLSSQSGCPLTCSFCATGGMRFGRNLTASEILDQALHFRRVHGRPDPAASRRVAGGEEPARGQVTHCAFMGMGEPMLNLENVLAACERLPDLGISHRRTTISTVGWIPGIERLAEVDMPLRLALSVHAADEALRSELMPVNERFALRDVLDACRAFYARKRRRIFIEYVLLAGVNDRYEQALALARALSGGRPAGARGTATLSSPARRDGASMFKVNLIPYNPTSTPAPYRGSSRQSIAAFRGALQAQGIDATVRLTRGRDIDAACGQLAARA